MGPPGRCAAAAAAAGGGGGRCGSGVAWVEMGAGNGFWPWLPISPGKLRGKL